MRKGKVVASTDEYTIFQRRDDRYAVKDADGNPVNGTAKIEILLKHDLIKAVMPAAEPEPEPEADATEEAAAEDAGEAAEADEAPAAEDDADTEEEDKGE